MHTRARVHHHHYHHKLVWQVNCKSTLFIDCEMDKWETMFRLNVFAVGICCREALKYMKQNGVDDGHIINVSRYVICYKSLAWFVRFLLVRQYTVSLLLLNNWHYSHGQCIAHCRYNTAVSFSNVSSS